MNVTAAQYMFKLTTTNYHATEQLLPRTSMHTLGNLYTDLAAFISNTL